MNKTQKLITEYLKESKRIKRTLAFLPESEDIAHLQKQAAFIDETIRDLGQKGEVLISLYIYRLSWENARERMFISANTLGRWRDSALASLESALDAAKIDIRAFDPYMGTAASKARMAAAKRKSERQIKRTACGA